jgi:hypothetical protein
VVDLVGLAAEAQKEHSGEVGMGGIPRKDAAEKICGFTVLGHSAAGAMGNRNDAIYIRIGLKHLRSEVSGDTPGYCGGAVDCREDTNVVASGDAAVGPDDSLEGRGLGGIQQGDGSRFGTTGVVAFEVAGDEVVGVDVVANRNGLGCEPNDLIELSDGLARGDSVEGHLVTSGNIGQRCKAKVGQDMARWNRLERDRDIIRVAEHKCSGNQTVPIFSRAYDLDEIIGTTTLYSKVGL